MPGRPRRSQDKPNPEEIDKRLAELLGNIPERASSLKKYIGSLTDVVHYYFDRFGPYLPSHMRREWTKLVLLSDMLSLDMESVRNRVETLETRVRKELLVDGGKGIGEETREELERSLEEIEKRAEELRQRTRELLAQLIRYVEETGIE